MTEEIRASSTCLLDGEAYGGRPIPDLGRSDQSYKTGLSCALDMNSGKKPLAFLLTFAVSWRAFSALPWASHLFTLQGLSCSRDTTMDVLHIGDYTLGELDRGMVQSEIGYA